MATGTRFAPGMMTYPGFERDFYVAGGPPGALYRVCVSET